jgi:hypothetical protein
MTPFGNLHQPPVVYIWEPPKPWNPSSGALTQ